MNYYINNHNFRVFTIAHQGYTINDKGEVKGLQYLTKYI